MIRDSPPMKVSSTSTSPRIFVEAPGLHREANTVEHEPRGLLGDAKRARQFVGADAVLRVREQPDRRKPLVQAERRILEDGSDLDGEVLAALASATPNPARLQERRLRCSATRADYARRPAKLHDKGEANVRVREVADRFGQSVGGSVFFEHGPNLSNYACGVKYIIALI